MDFLGSVFCSSLLISLITTKGSFFFPLRELCLYFHDGTNFTYTFLIIAFYNSSSLGNMLPESKDIIVFLAPGKLPAQCFKNRGPLKMLDDTHHITPWSEHNNGFLSHSGPLRSDSSPSGCSPRTVPPQTAPPNHPPY